MSFWISPTTGSREFEGREYDAILFRCGSLPDAPEMLVEYLGCERWSHCYAIKLGKIIELKRWPFQPVHHAAKRPDTGEGYFDASEEPNPAPHARR